MKFFRIVAFVAALFFSNAVFAEVTTFFTEVDTVGMPNAKNYNLEHVQTKLDEAHESFRNFIAQSTAKYGIEAEVFEIDMAKDYKQNPNLEAMGSKGNKAYITVANAVYGAEVDYLINNDQGDLAQWASDKGSDSYVGSGYSVFQIPDAASDSKPKSWQDVIDKASYKISFFSDMAKTTKQKINSVGIGVSDFGTTYNTGNYEPDGQNNSEHTTSVYGLIGAQNADGYSEQLIKKISKNLLGNASTPDAGDQFIGLNSDKKFDEVKFAFNGKGEYIYVGNYMIFSSFVPTIIEDTTIGQIENGDVDRIFYGGKLIIDTNYADRNSFQLLKKDGNTINVASNKFAYFEGIFSGEGGIIKEGGGILTLNAANTYSGKTVVKEGNLILGNSAQSASLAGDVEVKSGAYLAGYGSVGKVSPEIGLLNEGTVIVGNDGVSIGNLSTKGQYQQASTGALKLDISSTSNDQLNVAGEASLNGNILFNALEGSYHPMKYKLITAEKISGKLSISETNISDRTSLKHSLSYTANAVYLNLNPDETNTLAAMNSNENSLKSIFARQNNLQNIGLNYDCNLFGKHNICVSGGARYSGIRGLDGNVDNNGFDVNDNTNKNSQGAVLVVGYKKSDYSRYGFWIDQPINNKSRDGVAEVPVYLKKNNPTIGAYAHYSLSGKEYGFKLSLAGTYTENSIQIKRLQLQNTEEAKGVSDFRSYAGKAELGYSLVNRSQTINILPYVAYRYGVTTAAAYKEEETDKTYFPISYNKYQRALGTGIVGLKLYGRFRERYKMNTNFGFETDLRSKEQIYSGSSEILNLTSFSINSDMGRKQKKKRGFAQVGLSYDLTRQQSVGISGYYLRDAFNGVGSYSTLVNYTIGF